MADVFISYKTEERSVVIAIAELLRLQELTVWWDDRLQGERADKEIREQIELAAAVVVLLSRRSIGSDWVLGEIGRAGEKVVPVRIEKMASADLPTHLIPRDIIDLSDWTGDAGHPEFAKMIGRCIHLKTGHKPTVINPASAPSVRPAVKIEREPPRNTTVNRIENVSGKYVMLGTGATINVIGHGE